MRTLCRAELGHESLTGLDRDRLVHVTSVPRGSGGWTVVVSDYLCTAVPGYDAPTGNGTPNGLSAL